MNLTLIVKAELYANSCKQIPGNIQEKGFKAEKRKKLLNVTGSCWAVTLFRGKSEPCQTFKNVPFVKIVNG